MDNDAVIDRILTIIRESTYKTPMVETLPDTATAGTIVFDKETGAYYGHDGEEWQLLYNSNVSSNTMILSDPENPDPIIMEATNAETVIYFGDAALISKLKDNSNLYLNSAGSIVMVGEEYVFVNSPTWFADGVTLETKDGIPGSTALNSMTLWCSNESANVYPANTTGIPLASVRSKDGIIKTFDLINRSSILHLSLKEAGTVKEAVTVNDDNKKVIAFGESGQAWQVKFQQSTLAVDLLELNVSGISPPQGFIGGSGNKPLPAGVYRVEFKGRVISNPHRPSVENWSAAILGKIGDDPVTDLERQVFTIANHGVKALFEKNNIPYSYTESFDITGYVTSKGDAWVGPNVYSLTAAYKLSHATFIVTRVAS